MAVLFMCRLDEWHRLRHALRGAIAPLDRVWGGSHHPLQKVKPSFINETSPQRRVKLFHARIELACYRTATPMLNAKKDLTQARAIALNTSTRMVEHTLGRSNAVDMYTFQFNQRSSFQSELSTNGKAALHLINDRNTNGRVDRGEIIKRGRVRPGTTTLAKNRLEAGTYFMRVLPKSAPNATGEIDYQLTFSKTTDGGVTSSAVATRASTASQSATQNWNARFLNRDRSNLRNFRRYDFTQPDAMDDLGFQGRSGDMVARLDINYGRRSPTTGINKNRFAMEAWTRIELEGGSFYRISSKSDDGTRFYFKDPKTNQTVAELAGDWRNRKVRHPAWTQLLTPGASGSYDFYVQYFENSGNSVIDVALERVNLTGTVASSGLNVRSQPSTLNNTPINYLNQGEAFTIVKQVRSPNDIAYRDWYQIVTASGQSGYVAADSSFITVQDNSQIVAIGDVVTPPAPPPKPDLPGDGGSPGSAQGVISSKVWITSDRKISLRSTSDISGSELVRLGQNTPLTLVKKVTGGRYLNGFDEWYQVRTTVNGRNVDGYVAAYYVDVLNDGGRYETAISKENSLYKPHLTEAVTPTYYWTGYKPFADQAAAKYSWLNPSVIGGIGSRESGWGLLLSPKGPSGTGDGGHGRGLMQIDDRFHQSFISSGRWRNPQDNITYAIDEVLSRNYDYLDRNTNLAGENLLRGAIAAYNAGLGNVLDALSQGLDVDYYTTGQDYSWDVLNRAGWFQLHGWA